jgi:hypothetical protein
MEQKEFVNEAILRVKKDQSNPQQPSVEETFNMPDYDFLH